MIVRARYERHVGRVVVRRCRSGVVALEPVVFGSDEHNYQHTCLVERVAPCVARAILDDRVAGAELQLLAAEKVDHRLEFLPFWGHTPPPSGTVGPHVLSQWFPHRFETDGSPSCELGPSCDRKP